MKNSYNQTSVLKMNFEYSHNKTVLKDYYFTSPFKMLPPFDAENGFVRAMIMSSSGGILSGDVQEISLNVGENCKSELISQSYEKIHKMNEGFGTRNTTINVDSNATLHFMPLPTIPFADSAFVSTTEINLKDNTSKLIYNEIISAGRVHFGEAFKYKYFKSLTNIYQNGKLIYRDNSYYNPSEMDMTGFGMFEGYTHLLSQVVCNFENSNVKEIRNVIENLGFDIAFGVTEIENGSIVIRVLGKQGSIMEEISNAVANYCLK